MNSCTLASISRSRTPGFSHSYLIFHMAASPMEEAIFRSSISSRVLMTRAAEITGQPSDDVDAGFLEAAQGGHVEVIDGDALLHQICAP